MTVSSRFSVTRAPGGADTEDSPALPDQDLEAAAPDSDTVADVVEEYPDTDVEGTDSPPHWRQWLTRWRRPRNLALTFGVVLLVTLGGLLGWQALHTYQERQRAQLRAQFVQTARQGALNLTTIDWQHADSDIQRILNSATGTFHDDFSMRSQPFVDVVKQTQSKTQGSITEAGLEASTNNVAQVLVAVSVKTSTAAAPEQPPRAWRMRISVQEAGNDMKISDVVFVP